MLPMKNKNSTRYALITGASSGIGKAYASRLAHDGYNIIAIGRDEDALKIAIRQMPKPHEGSHKYLCADLSTKQGVRKVVNAAKVAEVVIANAGQTLAANIGDTSPSDREKLHYLLCGGVIDLAEAVLPKMKSNREGRFVIISSIAAYVPMPKSAVYAAAKSSISAYGRSAHLETKKFNVCVTTVHPGYVRTDIHRRAGLDHLEKKVPGILWSEPGFIVKSAEKASRAGRMEIIPGIIYRASLPFLSSQLVQKIWQLLVSRK